MWTAPAIKNWGKVHNKVQGWYTWFCWKKYNDFKVQREDGTQGTMRVHTVHAYTWMCAGSEVRTEHARETAHAYPHTYEGTPVTT